LKIELGWLGVAHETYPLVWDAILIVSIGTIEKYFGQILTTFSGRDTAEVGKVQNGARITHLKHTHIVSGAVFIISHHYD